MMQPPRTSPLRHGYLVQHPALNLALRARDTWLRHTRSTPSSATVAEPRRLLVCIGGHLGDAVLATSVLPILRAGYPAVAIGVLAPSPSLRAFENHPAVRWRHAFDHWRITRSGSAFQRWIAHRRSAARAVAEIRGIGYDTAIDLYPFFPNAARILSHASIPTRIGYASGGDGPLYSHVVAWVDTQRHTVDQHLELMRGFLSELPSAAPGYDLPPATPEEEARGRALLESLGIDGKPYLVLHPGAGNRRKQWPVHQWRTLVHRLRQRAPDVRILFTGRGRSDAETIDAVRGDDDSLISACGRTDWAELRYLLGHAALVIGVDSLAVHLAAAHAVPCIAIMASMSDPSHWRPLGPRIRVLTHDVPCAPCFRSAGCATMRCVRGVTAETVDSVALELLSSAQASAY